MKISSAPAPSALSMSGAGPVAPAQSAPATKPNTDGDFYVSPVGNDANAGTLAQPFASVEAAQRAVRNAIVAGASRNFTVLLRGGTYELHDTLRFSAQDTARVEGAAYTTTYAAYGDEVPVLSGGRTITDWRRNAQGIWTTKLDTTQWYPRQLFADGRRLQRARTPNIGEYLRVAGSISQEEQGRFNFGPGEIRPEWADGDTEIIALQKWAELRMQIRKVEGDRVTLAGKITPSNREDNARYWVENTPDALDEPGEWYLSRKTGELSYLPRDGENPAQMTFVASRLTQLVGLEGTAQSPVRGLHVEGLHLLYADWALGENGYADMQAANDIPGVVSGEYVEDCVFRRCVIAHCGNYGFDLGRGCRNNSVLGCELFDLGAGGVKLGEVQMREDAADAARNQRVENCSIHDYGEIYPAAIGVWIGQSAGNRVAHNLIFNGYYTAISVGWTWGYAHSPTRDNIIEGNDIHNIGREMLSDLGGIYLLGVQPGTVVRGNRIRDIRSNPGGYGGWGIYTDEGSTDILIENNLVYRTKNGGFHQHYGRNNIVRNNIFAFGDEAQLVRTRSEAHQSFRIERNIVLSNGGPMLGSNWQDNSFAIDHNLYFDFNTATPTFSGMTFDQWQSQGHDVHSFVADPLFNDAQADDFSLKSDAMVIKIGFKPFDFSTVGPQAKPTD